MGTILTIVTLAVVAVVVLALVIYLLLIIKTLYNANKHLSELAEGLQEIRNHTEPLPEKMTTINGALSQLLSRLLAVNEDLAAVARLLGR